MNKKILTSHSLYLYLSTMRSFQKGDLERNFYRQFAFSYDLSHQQTKATKIGITVTLSSYDYLSLSLSLSLSHTHTHTDTELLAIPVSL